MNSKVLILINCHQSAAVTESNKGVHRSSLCRCRIFPGKRHHLEKLTVTQLVKYISTFHVTSRQITVFAISYIWILQSFILIYLTFPLITSLIFEISQISIRAPTASSLQFSLI